MKELYSLQCNCWTFKPGRGGPYGRTTFAPAKPPRKC